MGKILQQESSIIDMGKKVSNPHLLLVTTDMRNKSKSFPLARNQKSGCIFSGFYVLANTVVAMLFVRANVERLCLKADH